MSDERIKHQHDADYAAAVLRAIARDFPVFANAKLGEMSFGYGSTVAEISGIEQDLVLRVHTNGSNEDPLSLIRAYLTSGNTGVKELLAITRDDQNDLGVLPIPYSEVPSLVEAETTNLQEINIIGIAQLLEKLPMGVSLTDLINSTNPDDWSRVDQVFENFGTHLQALHMQPINIPDGDANKWRQIASTHPIMGPERFDDIITYLEGAPWVEGQLLPKIRSRMLEVSSQLAKSGLPLRRIHGDFWRENLRVTSDNQVTSFDRALSLGYPGYDFAFAIGDQLIFSLITGEKLYHQNVESFVKGYGNGELFEESLQSAFVPFAFKCVVGAAFDRYPVWKRMHLLRLAAWTLKNKINYPEKKFDYQEVVDYWHETFKRPLSQARLARQLAPPTEPWSAAHFPTQIGEFTPVYDYLVGANANPNDISNAFSPDSKIVTPDLSTKLTWDLDYNAFRMILENRASNFYRLNNLSLNAATNWGFNDHGLHAHVRVVVDRSIALLNKFGATDLEKKMAAVVGVFHDLGNNLSRQVHSWISVNFSQHLAPELLVNQVNLDSIKRARIIRKGIQIHDEEVIKYVFDTIIRQQEIDLNNSDSLDTLYQLVFKTFGAGALAVIAADKSDCLDQRRMPDNDKGEGGKSALNGDSHIEVVLLGESEAHTFWDHEGKTKIQRRIKFTPGLAASPEQVKQKAGPFVKSDRGRFMVSDWMHEMHKEIGIPHFFSWQMLNNSINLARLKNEAIALFSLFPTADKFKLIFSDESDTDLGSGLHMEYVLTRSSLFSDLRAISRLSKNTTTPLEVPDFFKRHSEIWKNSIRTEIFSQIKSDLTNLPQDKTFYEFSIDDMADQSPFRLVYRIHRNGLAQFRAYIDKLFRYA